MKNWIYFPDSPIIFAILISFLLLVTIDGTSAAGWSRKLQAKKLIARQNSVTFRVAEVQENAFYFQRASKRDAASVIAKNFQALNQTSPDEKFSPNDEILKYETGEFNAKYLVNVTQAYVKSPRKSRKQKRTWQKQGTTARPLKHAFISAVLTAYNLHIPLELSPDDFWLMISLGVAQHLAYSDNAKRHRGNFVEHEGKKKLRVEMNKYNINPSRRRENRLNWPIAIEKMSREIEDNTITNISAIITNPFSTSGPIELTAFRVALMDTMKQYFEYQFEILCGIPSITLRGSTRDYRNIIKRIDQLKVLLPSFHWYLDRVRIDTQKLVQTSKGRPIIGWWKNMVHEKVDKGGGCGLVHAPLITGWITHWIAYTHLREGGTQPNNHNNRVGQSVSTEDLDYPAVTLTPAKVFHWRFGTEHKMQFTGGFVGVAQDRKTRRLKPAIGWMSFYQGDSVYRDKEKNNPQRSIFRA